MKALRAFACRLTCDPEPGKETIVNARSASAARYRYLLHLDMDVPFISVRARVAGPPAEMDGFREVCQRRGMPHVTVGSRVKVGADFGVIVGHNYSCNFEVLFDTGACAGVVHSVHPGDIEIVGEESK